MIRITATMKGESFATRLRRKLQGPEFQAFLDETAADMVAQVRRNVITLGGPGGAWPQLSGYNAGIARRKEAKATIRGLKSVGVGLGDLDADRARQLRREAKSTSRHAGYAAQKEAGLAAGRLKYGPAERLRATGGLVASLVARVEKLTHKAVVALTADGRAPNGTPYSVVLKANAKGTARIPARDPTLAMEQFLKRTARRLAAVLNAH